MFISDILFYVDPIYDEMKIISCHLATELFCGVAMKSLIFSTYTQMENDFKTLSSVNSHHEYLYDLYIFDQHIYYSWVSVFKNGSSKSCGRQPLKNLKWYGLFKLNT